MSLALIHEWENPGSYEKGRDTEQGGAVRVRQTTNHFPNWNRISRHSSVLTWYSTGTNIWFKLLLFYAGFFLLLQYLILGILYLKYFNLNNSTIQIFQFYSDDSVFIKWKVSYKSGVNIPSHLLTRADRLVTYRNIFNLIGETTLSRDHQLQLQHQIQNHRPSQHLEIFHLKRFLDETRNSIEWF